MRSKRELLVDDRDGMLIDLKLKAYYVHFLINIFMADRLV